MSKYHQSRATEGHVVYKNVPSSKGLERFIEKHISKWIDCHSSMMETNIFPISYRVLFEREGSCSSVGCRVELEMSHIRWVGMEAAHSADIALLKSLQRMMPKAGMANHASAWTAFSRAS